MSYPASLTLLTLTGQFLDGANDGQGRTGMVTVTLPVPIRSTGDDVIIPQFQVETELNLDGTFSIEVPALTDPEWIPNTTEYIVQATFFEDFHKLWWSVPAPWDTAGGTVDLADCGTPNIGTPNNTLLVGTTTVTQDGGYKGLWDVGTVYRAGDTVEHDGAVYGALSTSSGIEPGTDADVWTAYPGGGGGGAVSSVFGRTGAVTAQTGDYTKTNVGLGNVDNTADMAKPVSTLQAAADTAVANAAAGALTAHEADTTAVHGIADTAALVLTGDARLGDERTPTNGSVTTAKIVDANVTLAKLANIAAATILGNNTGGAAAPLALTAAQVKTLLAIAQSDVSGLTAALALLAPLASPALTGTATAVNLTLSGRQLNTPVALTDAATIAVNAALGNDFTVTLGGNRTLGNPTNPINGQKITFAIRQDGSGTRTLTLDTAYRLGTDISSVTLSTAINKTDYLGVRYNGTDSKWDVIAFVKGY
jgi:hypothetical protein